MGCSTSSVVPLAESDIDDACGIKVRVNPSTPDQITHKNGAILHGTDPPTETLANDFSRKITNGKKRSVPDFLSPSTRITNYLPFVFTAAPLAFEVPIFDEDSLIRKHPPRRFRRFGDSDDEQELTHDVLDEKQREAEKRRREILSQRVMSAKTRPRPKQLVHSDAFSQDVRS